MIYLIIVLAWLLVGYISTIIGAKLLKLSFKDMDTRAKIMLTLTGPLNLIGAVVVYFMEKAN